MTLEEFYNKTGSDYAEVMGRLPSAKLVLKFVLKFPNDPSYQQLKDAALEGNIENAFKAAHTLKGVSGNLSFAKLTEAVSALTEQLRPLAQKPDPLLLAKVDEAYALIIDNIPEIDQ